MLLENSEIVGEEEVIVGMNNYFTNITAYLKLKHTITNPKVNLKSIINTFQNSESVWGNNLSNFHSKSSLKLESVSKPSFLI